MKKELLVLDILIFSYSFLSAQSLTIRIENADIDQGYLMIGISNYESKFSG